jgi:hypothetical protein
MRKCLTFFLALLLPVGIGCQYRPLVRVGGQGGFGSVFNGFIYVGRDINRESHDSPGLAFPARLIPGHTYAFHHERPFDSVVFARKTLPERLRLIGLAVTKSVDSGQAPYIAEPATIWSVEFARGACSGIVYTDVCLDLASRRIFRDSRLYEEDYDIRLKGDCSELPEGSAQSEPPHAAQRPQGSR